MGPDLCCSQDSRCWGGADPGRAQDRAGPQPTDLLCPRSHHAAWFLLPCSPAPGGTAELGQRPPSDQALLLFKFFKLTRTSQSSSSAVSCCLHYFKRRTGIVSCCYQRTQPCKMMEAGPSINSLQMSLWLTHQGKNCLLFFVHFLGLHKWKVHSAAHCRKVLQGAHQHRGEHWGKALFFHLHAQLLHRNSKV